MYLYSDFSEFPLFKLVQGLCLLYPRFYIYIHVCICKCIYIYIYIYTYVYTYIYM